MEFNMLSGIKRESDSSR